MQAKRESGDPRRRCVAFMLVLLAVFANLMPIAFGSESVELPPPNLPPPPVGAASDDAMAEEPLYLPPMPEPWQQIIDAPTDAAPLPKELFELGIKNVAVLAEAAPATKVLEATDLNAAEVGAILARLTPLKISAPVEPKLPDRAKAPPGKQVTLPFPPAADVAPERPPSDHQKTREPLRVVRFAPEGEVARYANQQLAISFSQPMVPISTIGEASATQPANFVKVQPAIKGTWKWIDARTLLFEPEGKRLPRAGLYNVQIPAGVKAATGATLSKSVSWQFRTEAPSLVDFAPSDVSHTQNPVMVALFNQPVNADVALKKITVTALAPGQKNSVNYPVHRAPRSLVDRDKYLNQLQDFKSDRYLFFMADKQFPRGATVDITFGAGILGRSGSRVMAAPESRHFAVFDRLKPQPIDALTPSQTVSVQFNNYLNIKKFNPRMVQVSPPIPDAKIAASANSITIDGYKKFGIKYSVRLDKGLTDVYGQELGAEKVLPVIIKRFEPSMFTSYRTDRPFALAPDQKDFSLFTLNYPGIKVSIYKVQAGQWTVNPEKLIHKAKPVWSATVPTNGRADQIAETKIKLTPFLQSGHGHLVLRAEPTPQRDNYKSSLTLWLQASNLALRTVTDKAHTHAFVTELKSGKAVSGAKLQIGKLDAVTNEFGIATLGNLPKRPVLLVSKSTDSNAGTKPAFEEYYLDSTVESSSLTKLWYSFTDRGLYRPGEEVQVKGCCRTRGGEALAQLAMPSQASKSITVKDSTGIEIFKGAVKPDAFGAFAFSFKVPTSAAPGNASIEADNETIGALSIQEFRRPEFSVVVEDSHGDVTHVLGEAPPVVRLSASYLSGGPLGGANLHWNVTGERSAFSPAGWDEYSFQAGENSDNERSPGPCTLSAKTSADGKAALELNVRNLLMPRPLQLKVQGTVSDLNRQSLSGDASILIHPSRLYAGISCDRWFVKTGEATPVRLICSDIDGKAKNAAVKLKTILRSYSDGAGGRGVETPVSEQLVQVDGRPQELSLRFEKPGRYIMRAEVTDENGRMNIAEKQLDVYPSDSGFDFYRPASSTQSKLELSLDKKSYRPGDVARVVVKSPFDAANGVVTIIRGAIVESKPFSLTGKLGFWEIPIKDAYTPDITADVYLVETKGSDRKSGDMWWARHTSATVSVPVPAPGRTLAVNVTPEKQQFAPGENATIDVFVKDADGKPVANSQVTLAVVDESVLMIASYLMPNPISTFYAEIGDHCSRIDSADYLTFLDAVTARKTMEAFHRMPSVACAKARAGGGGGGGYGSASLPPPCLPPPPLSKSEGDAAPPPPPPGDADKFAFAPNSSSTSEPPLTVRSNFDPLAVFKTNAVTGPDGSARISFKLPDNLTRYRAMAFAISGEKHFGIGESSITASLPLSLRQSPPRFLNLGDRFELSFVLQNQSDKDQNVSLALRASSKDLRGGVGKKVVLAAGQRGEVRFAVQPDATGNLLFQSAAMGENFADAQEFSVPVLTPATLETFAAYGSLSKNNELLNQPVKPPGDIFTQVGALEVSTTSTAMQELTDAVVYLKNYRFDCSEQLSSRIITLAALKNILVAFRVSGLDAAQIDACINGSVKELLSRQSSTGSFGFWKPDSSYDPYVSVYAAEALRTASEAGFKVDARSLDRCKNYLREIDRNIPTDYGENTKDEIRAYALAVRRSFGEQSEALASVLLKRNSLEKKSPEFLCRMLQAIDQLPSLAAVARTIEQKLNNSINETASTAACSWSASRDSYLLFQSPVRTTALVLDRLIQRSPDNPVIPKLVKGLLLSRRRGYWGNTQENAVCALALHRYFQTYEKTDPDFTANIWLGDLFLGESTFKGRSTATNNLTLPIESLYSRWEREQSLLISKQGAGRLYYRIGLTYAPKNLQLSSLDRGFTVSRSYQAVDSPSDLKRTSDGVWHVKAGALVKVKLKVGTGADRYRIALTDPLPAGFEPLNPDLAGTRTVSDSDNSPPDATKWWYRPQWYDHTNLRDARAEVFSSLLPEGEYSYSYFARASTIGQFTAPPPKAEEMYTPETFGRGNTDSVVVE